MDDVDLATAAALGKASPPQPTVTYVDVVQDEDEWATLAGLTLPTAQQERPKTFELKKRRHQFRNESELDESKGDFLILARELELRDEAWIEYTLWTGRDETSQRHPNLFYLRGSSKLLGMYIYEPHYEIIVLLACQVDESGKGPKVANSDWKLVLRKTRDKDGRHMLIAYNRGDEKFQNASGEEIFGTDVTSAMTIDGKYFIDLLLLLSEEFYLMLDLMQAT